MVTMISFCVLTAPVNSLNLLSAHTHNRILQGSGSLSLGSSSAAIRNAQSLATSIQMDGDTKKKKTTSTSNTAKKKRVPSMPSSISAPLPPATASIPQQTPRTTSTAEALLNMSAFTGPIEPDDNDLQETHFGSYTATTTSYAPNPLESLQIKVPSMDESKMYPEPSPAACGKRKIAEITAAQMLVGCSASTAHGDGVGGGDTANTGYSPDSLKKSEMYPFESEDDAFLAEVFGVENEGRSSMVVGSGSVGNPLLGGGSSLQIVNPDSLGGGGGGGEKRRSLNGQASPCTPWDGQLEALVR